MADDNDQEQQQKQNQAMAAKFVQATPDVGAPKSGVEIGAQKAGEASTTFKSAMPKVDAAAGGVQIGGQRAAAPAQPEAPAAEGPKAEGPKAGGDIKIGGHRESAPKPAGHTWEKQLRVR
jgi:hypothetical protein